MLGILLTMAISKPELHTFSYIDAQAKQVQFVGDITDWDSPKAMVKKGKEWTISFPVYADSRFEYHFIVDGKYILDPSNSNSVDNSIGGLNSVYQGPGYQLSAPDQAPKHPWHRRTTKVGGREVIIWAPSNAEGLPILAMGDGPNYEKYGHLPEIAANLVAAGKIRPFVIALVPPIERRREYGPDWKEYGSYLLNDVLPEVRKLTQASKKATDVFVGGSSMGGVISLRLAEEFPQALAGGIWCQSTALQWHLSGYKAPELYTEDAFSKIAHSTKIWLCWGIYEDGLTPCNQQAVKTLKKMKRTFASWETREGHNWTAWRHRTARALEYLFSIK